MNTIIKESVIGFGFYIWQLEAYGERVYYADKPCSIYTTRPMPCTPSGDLVCDCATVTEAIALMDKIAGMSLEDARAYVADPIGMEKCRRKAGEIVHVEHKLVDGEWFTTERRNGEASQGTDAGAARQGGNTSADSAVIPAAAPSAGTIDTPEFRAKAAEWWGVAGAFESRALTDMIAYIMDWHSAGVAAARDVAHAEGWAEAYKAMQARGEKREAAAREQALEEAAAVCDARAKSYFNPSDTAVFYYVAAASAIRALASQPATTAQTDELSVDRDLSERLRGMFASWTGTQGFDHRWLLAAADEIDRLSAAAPVAQAPVVQEWVGLADSQWVNIVNHQHCYENLEKEDAVHLAVKLTEGRLKANNAAPVAAPTQEGSK